MTVPKLWPGETFVVIGSGPSLTPEDVAAVRGRARAIAVNSSYLLAPWADVLYSCDAKWWRWHQGVPTFAGLKYSLDPAAAQWPGVQVLENTGLLGLECAPSGLRTGCNSGYQSVNLAVHLGAARILLLGFDQRIHADGRDHWHPPHPDHQPSPYAAFLSTWPSIVAPLDDAGVTVVNCTPDSALTVFPMVSLADALAVECAA